MRISDGGVGRQAAAIPSERLKRRATTTRGTPTSYTGIGAPRGLPIGSRSERILGAERDRPVPPVPRVRPEGGVVETVHRDAVVVLIEGVQEIAANQHAVRAEQTEALGEAQVPVEP